MSIVSGILVVAALIVAVAAVYFMLRPRPDDLFEWTDAAYEPPHSEPPRAITRIRSKDISWEIEP